MLALVALLLVPSLATSVQAADAPSPSLPTVSIPEAGWSDIARWIRGGDPSPPVPTTFDGWMAKLGSGAPLPPATGGLDAYFAAFGLVPTAAERAQLDRFRLEHPAVAARFESLAAEVGRAETLRQQAFSRLDADQRARLPDVAARLASGEPLSADDLAIVRLVDMTRMVDAARALAAATDALRLELPRATAVDAALAGALPGRLDPASLRDAGSALRAFAEGATPVHVDATPD
ncbi:MAG TPA: hypothetical protein VHH36_00285, partial [Candidatus Thermoplasmatota archaeon]|nr:hypothetical protein [Candidatus Thermoplasmatota archaeon]